MLSAWNLKPYTDYTGWLYVTKWQALMDQHDFIAACFHCLSYPTKYKVMLIVQKSQRQHQRMSKDTA